jgi:hypothetical protein
MSSVHVFYMGTKSVGSINLCDRPPAYYRSSVHVTERPDRFNHLVVFMTVSCMLMYH